MAYPVVELLAEKLHTVLTRERIGNLTHSLCALRAGNLLVRDSSSQTTYIT